MENLFLNKEDLLSLNFELVGNILNEDKRQMYLNKELDIFLSIRNGFLGANISHMIIKRYNNGDKTEELWEGFVPNISYFTHFLFNKIL